MQHTRWCRSMAGEEYARTYSWGNDPKRLVGKPLLQDLPFTDKGLPRVITMLQVLAIMWTCLRLCLNLFLCTMQHSMALRAALIPFFYLSNTNHQVQSAAKSKTTSRTRLILSDPSISSVATVLGARFSGNWRFLLSRNLVKVWPSISWSESISRTLSKIEWAIFTGSCSPIKNILILVGIVLSGW